MGEILTAYQTLNRTLNLGLSKQQMLAAEMQFKIDFAEKMKFPASLTKSPGKLSAEWEVTSTLTPRRRKLRSLTKQSLTQLKSSALKEMDKKMGRTEKAKPKVTVTRRKRVTRRKK